MVWNLLISTSKNNVLFLPTIHCLWIGKDRRKKEIARQNTPFTLIKMTKKLLDILAYVGNWTLAFLSTSRVLHMWDRVNLGLKEFWIYFLKMHILCISQFSIHHDLTPWELPADWSKWEFDHILDQSQNV